MKVKWPKKGGRSQDACDKDNVVPHKKFNVVERGYGSQHENQQSKGNGRKPLRCWTCCGEDPRTYLPSHHGRGFEI